MKGLVRRLKDFNELVMFQHSVFSLPFIFIAMVVASHGWFGWRLLGLGVLAALSARNFAMGVNRYVDRDIDAENPRTKNRPNADGRLNAKAIAVFIVLNGLAFVVTAWSINMTAFVLAFPILAFLAAYSYFKRFSETAHLILGLTLGLAPIAGVIAVEAAVPLWSVLLALGVTCWVAGFDLLYSLQDIEFDKAAGLYSVPSRYGPEATLFISALLHVNTVIFWALFVWAAGLGAFAWTAVFVSAVMLYYEHRLVRRDFTKIDRAFFTVNGYLGIVFLLLIVADAAAG